MKDTKKALEDVGLLMRSLRESMGFPVVRGKITGLLQQNLLAQQRQLQYQPVNKAQMGQAGGGEVAEKIALSPQVGEPHQPSPPLPKLETPNIIRQRLGQMNLMPIRSALSQFVLDLGETTKLKAKSEVERAESERKKAEEPKSIHLRRG